MGRRLSLELHPNRDVGGIRLGSPVDPYIQMFSLTHDDSLDLDEVGSKSFVDAGDSLRVDTISGRVDSISCYESLIFENTELIGAALGDLAILFKGNNLRHDIERYQIGDDEQSIVYVDGLGISLWIDAEQIVRSVDCRDDLDS